MTTSIETKFNQDFQKLQQHLTLKGLQQSSIVSYSHGVRRIARYFDYHIYDLSEQKLTDYFTDLLITHSWSSLKLDLYGLKFFYRFVLNEKWPHIDLIKSPRALKIPNIITTSEASRIFRSTRVVSYRVFFFTVYSLGLRISEGLRLEVGDIDSHRMRVHVRDSKGNKDRLVPLPVVTLDVLRRFWSIHRNPTLLFPNRKGGLQCSHVATTPLSQAGVSKALSVVATACGIKKRSLCTLYGTAMRHISLSLVLIYLKCNKFLVTAAF